MLTLNDKVSAQVCGTFKRHHACSCRLMKRILFLTLVIGLLMHTGLSGQKTADLASQFANSPMAERLAEICNLTGIGLMDFNRLWGHSASGYGD